mgnify:CR=1 FL=1
MQDLTPAQAALRDAARNYHRQPTRGKVAVVPTKPLSNQHDLSLAYSPGVAYPCLDIQADPSKAAEYTSRGNLVGVITNGTAVLGLGDIGPLAGKPVMEGKGCLFKKFAGIDVFDIELAERDPDKLVEIISALEPTLGGINLEDIKAPECFYIERQLREKMKIPVFHDDQHGTAIVTLAALINALKVVGKNIEEARIVVSGVGAAGSAIIRLLLLHGARDVIGYGRKGALGPFREEANPHRNWLAQNTNPRGFQGSLQEALEGADVFIGVSSGNILTGEDVSTMAEGAIVFAMANPTPEVDPIGAAEHVSVVATGRSDFPNQINNVLAFPGLFRGLLDTGITNISTELLRAAATGIASVISDDEISPVYIIPNAFDTRVADAVAAAVRRFAED